MTYALGNLSWPEVQALQSARRDQFSANKVDACALAVLRHFEGWTFSDSTPCQ